MIPTSLLHRTWFQVLLATVAAVLVTIAASQPLRLQGFLTQRKVAPSWLVLTAQQVESGATIPADTNVVFHLPADIWPINRKALLGRSGTTVRYWGYCFPEEESGATVKTSSGFPGKLFLSEAERAWRASRLAAKVPNFSPLHPPTTPNQVQELSDLSASRIRNEFEIFRPGSTCYIMTSSPLPIGTDRDGDGLNSREEKGLRTDPANADTDGDGLSDGVEVLIAHTDPLRRDTDGDGLIDGLEDKNRNGRVDPGETSPTNADTDGDGLCDGFCRMDRSGRICQEFTATTSCNDLAKAKWMGEDKNLNGQVDQGETDPTKWSTAGDGVSDLQHYYNCLLQGGGQLCN